MSKSLLMICAVCGIFSTQHVRADELAALTKRLELLAVPRKKIYENFHASLQRCAQRSRVDRRIAPEFRERTAEKFDQAAKEFKLHGRLPTDDDVIPETVQFLDLFYQRRNSAMLQYSKLEDKHEDNATAIKMIADEKQAWTPPGAGRLQVRQRWHGTRTFSDGGVVDFHIHFDVVDQAAIEGSFWQDARSIYRRGWEIKGTVHGNQLILETTERLDGKGAIFTSKGYLIENRVVMTSFADKPMQDKINVWLQ